MATFGVIVFPGSNCDHDAYHAAKDVLGQEAEYIWHKDTDLKGADVVILPGGFAHGDYLRCGAMARFSPIMREVAAFVSERLSPLEGVLSTSTHFMLKTYKRFGVLMHQPASDERLIVTP